MPRCLRLTDDFRPFSLLALTSAIVLTTLLAVSVDTTFYNPSAALLKTMLTAPTFTPLNSLLYNSQSSNLAHHGLHPHYQHLVASLPLLLGPALYLLIFSPNCKSSQLPLLSGLSGALLLSCIPHQEPRFLLPAVPLVLSSIRLPRSKLGARYWLGCWTVFNAIFGVLMGVYHQGGVVPAQIWIGEQANLSAKMSEVMWWRTYSPPVWLLDHNPLKTTDLMGIPFFELQSRIQASLGPGCDSSNSVGLVTPYSSLEIDNAPAWEQEGMVLEELWRYGRHLNLDDLDFAEDGILATLTRVVGGRGLVIWKVMRRCKVDKPGMMQGDW